MCSSRIHERPLSSVATDWIPPGWIRRNSRKSIARTPSIATKWRPFDGTASFRIHIYESTDPNVWSFRSTDPNERSGENRGNPAESGNHSRSLKSFRLVGASPTLDHTSQAKFLFPSLNLVNSWHYWIDLMSYFLIGGIVAFYEALN